jgi:hypothetical protein
MVKFTGKIKSGCQDASRGWNWASIKAVLGDQSLYHGTINISLADYHDFRFQSDISFPDHKRPDGRPEGVDFQRCRLRVAEVESDAYIAKTTYDYWGKQEIVEVIAPFIDGASSEVPAEIIVSN